ncbi:hypothetical protein EJ04DRAFT_564937 [Polyplosphaeria fusca]|uniref:Uncharacterized protein n=1 Tax=Polyplosphaeria fusca TaxID=682080 RepID=A0A9P4UYZ2_9PLEO|nr:hypothetical protein EJ04DRAFT_564937 [Polyplosphaeria fusca]
MAARREILANFGTVATIPDIGPGNAMDGWGVWPSWQWYDPAFPPKKGWVVFYEVDGPSTGSSPQTGSGQQPDRGQLSGDGNSFANRGGIHLTSGFVFNENLAEAIWRHPSKPSLKWYIKPYKNTSWALEKKNSGEPRLEFTECGSVDLEFLDDLKLRMPDVAKDFVDGRFN